MSLDINLENLSSDDRRDLEHKLGISTAAKGVFSMSVHGDPILVLAVTMPKTEPGPAVSCESKLSPSSTQHLLASVLLMHVRDHEHNDMLRDEPTSRLILAARAILSGL